MTGRILGEIAEVARGSKITKWIFISAGPGSHSVSRRIGFASVKIDDSDLCSDKSTG